MRRASWIAEEAESTPATFRLHADLGDPRRESITGDHVPFTAENLIGGFLGLLPGGNRLFEELKETGALQNAFDWVSASLTSSTSPGRGSRASSTR